MLCNSQGHAGTVDSTAIDRTHAPAVLPLWWTTPHLRERRSRWHAAEPLSSILSRGQTPRSLHAMMHDLNLEYAARVADAQHYYACVPGGLVQPPVTVPELEMQPQTQGGLHCLHGAALEMQPPPQAGLHLLHTTPALHPGPPPMALPSIVGD